MNICEQISGELHTRHNQFELAETFTISRGSKNSAETITVEIRSDNICGRGECVPYARYGETISSVRSQIQSVAEDLNEGMSRHQLMQRLPAGAARNAVDCALWDIQLKRSNQDLFADFLEPITAVTVSYSTADEMYRSAKLKSDFPIIKIKLASNDDKDRLRAVRAGAPHSKLVVDANEGWSLPDFLKMAPELEACGVAVVEQPLPAANDGGLKSGQYKFALCADESCHDRNSLPGIFGKYDMINIKLDKTGGLTEATALKATAQKAGLRVMIGCMVSSSLGIAPALALADGADLVDLDGPILLSEDRPHAIHFRGSQIQKPSRDLWG